MYFDGASTTKILPEVLEAMMPFLKDNYGNASSHYSLGQISKAAIEDAREIVASYLGCDSEEIYFTSGGTESNNWAIKGLINNSVHPIHMVSSNIEHHSITESLKSRREMYRDMTFDLVPVERNGLMDPDRIAEHFKLNTRLCSIQMVNNELGTVQPISQIAAKCYDNNIIFHCDAVQAYGHMPINVKDLNINLLSASGHKLGSMKGIGVLYLSNDLKSQYASFMSGGQQEHGMRASTECVPSIVGLGKATELAVKKMEQNHYYIKGLANMLESELEKINYVHMNVLPELTDYRHFNIRADGIRAEELMSMLDAQEVFVSAGSACASDSNEPSHVLKAIGLTDGEANSSIRISLCEDNTKEEIEYLIKCLKYDIEILRNRGV